MGDRRRPRSKLCKFCDQPLSSRRRSYHGECLAKARDEGRDQRRRCGRCGKLRAPSSFSDDSTRADGKFPWCKTCQNDYAKGRRFQNPDDPLNGKTCPLCDTPIRGRFNRVFCSDPCKNRVASLRKKFGLTVEEYRRLVEDASGRCPICQHKVRQWHVDHDHRTGLVTGVVCAGCNVGALAHTHHDSERAQRLANYLRETPAQRLGIEAKAPEGVHKPSRIHAMWDRKAA